MKVGIIPKASAMRLRSKLNKGVLRKRIKFVKMQISRSRIERLLKQDEKRVFWKNATSVKQLIKSNAFASLDGDMSALLDAIDSRGKLEFLVLAYIGKTLNNLKSDFKWPDFSTLLFLNRLDKFASRIERLTGKKTTVSIAKENEVFNEDILRIKSPFSKKILKRTERLLNEFKFTHVKITPLADLIGGKDYQKEFQTSLRRFEKKGALVKRIENFDKILYVFLTSFPTGSFKEAVRMYTNKSKLKKIEKWAFESTIRYFAFHEARGRLDFWGHNKRYLRSSVAKRNGVLSFGYEIGRLSPLHGVATVQNGRISTEYFYDIVEASKGEDVVLPVWYYKDLPLCIDATGIKLK